MTTSSILTETDILKSIVKKGSFSDTCRELNANLGIDGASKEEQHREQLRVVAKIWTALNKLIRSQCNKDRIIDSLFFGSFGKTQVVMEDPMASRTYTYCPGPKSLFRLLENAENMGNVSQTVIDKKLVSASFSAIAEVVNCGADLVQAVLQLVRDEVLDNVQQKKKEVNLNLQIGTLTLSPAQTVQFKSLSVNEVTAQSQAASGTMSLRLTEASLRGLDTRGQNTASQRTLDDRSIAERSINYMQQRQSTASVGSRARRQGSTTQKNDIFATPSQAGDKGVLNKLEGATEDAPYFQRRMARTAGRRGSNYADSRRKDVPNNELEMQKQHTHLDQFLRDQIMSQKSGQSKRSTMSCTSSKKNNNLIEMAAKNKYTSQAKAKKAAKTGANTARRSLEPHTTNPDGKGENELMIAANVMRQACYQADPLAATMNTRSLGLSKVNVTKEQLAHDKDLYTKSKQVNKNRINEGLVIHASDSISQATSKMASPRIIKDLTDVEAALYRKKISDKYHTSVPKFLRSQGPFAVYDHAAHKGGRTYETIGAVNEQALTRFNEGNNDIQKRREAEKSQFYAVMDYMDREQAFRHVNKVKMNMANVDFIRTQIDDKARVKNAEKQVETLYYKPQFRLARDSS